MYVRNGARITSLVWQERRSLVALGVLAVVTELGESYFSQFELFSVVYVGVFSTALSIFLVFRFNESYERWWEARTLWGRLVNASRSFARQALTLLDADQVASEGRRLVLRQIAFAHALRIRLRAGGTGGSGAGAAEMHEQLRRLVPDEAEALGRSQNVPNALLARNSERLAALLRDSVEGRILLAQFDDTFLVLHDVQGGCERIKGTTFPDSVTLITRFLVWGLVILLLLATVEPDGRGGITPTLAVCVMSMGYLWIDALGGDLKNPFDGAPNDTPMTSLSVTIERDLREMLGEEDLPAPVEPVDGVLM